MQRKQQTMQMLAEKEPPDENTEKQTPDEVPVKMLAEKDSPDENPGDPEQGEKQTPDEEE